MLRPVHEDDRDRPIYWIYHGTIIYPDVNICIYLIYLKYLTCTELNIQIQFDLHQLIREIS